MDRSGVTLFICVTCTGQDPAAPRPGRLLFDSVACHTELAHADVVPVECLSVCKRPCTVALSAPGKWTYIVGDLDHALHRDDVIAAAGLYAGTENGIIPWRQRPAAFRTGLVGRVPPVPGRPA